MNSVKSPLEYWLAEISAAAGAEDDVWEPGFEGGRQAVAAKLGPYRKVYPRHQVFKQRFYHTVYPLPIEDWEIITQTKLYGGFCSIAATMTIRFQASVKYAQANVEALPSINAHIKSAYETLIRDAVDQELRQLDDGEWVETGLSHVEKRLQTYINETLTVQHIHCRALCTIVSSFADLAQATQLDGRFAREDIYLKVLKKSFEIRERQEHERFRQEQALERQRLEQQQRLIEQRKREQELKRVEQLIETENIKRRLEEQERQQIEQLKIEERLHREQVLQRQRQKTLEQEIETETQQQQHAKQLQLERQLEEERAEHQRQLKAKHLAEGIEEFTIQQTTWNKTNEHFRLEKIHQEERLKQMEYEAELKLQEAKAGEEQKLHERLQKEKLKHESRLKEMELEMEIQEQKKRYEATQQIDEYLRHDIELLILEKHRSELVQSILKSKQGFLPQQGLPQAAEE
jgi:hypothetical protein